MLTWEEDVEAHALRRRGWTISAIARHLGRDPKTIRAYLKGERSPGQRIRSAADPFDRYAEYCRIRLADDPHLWASTLFEEARELGYPGGYSSFTRALRARRLRPHCEPCQASRGRDHAIIAHPPGEETQFDWLELPDPPRSWGWGAKAFLLVGALSHSGRWRAVLAESTDQAHLVEALDGVVRRLGGCTQRWRFDRMATVCQPGSGQLTASFAAVAKHYAVAVDICPARHGNRKGVVEKANHGAAQRWWRTLGDEMSVAQAQRHLDAWCARVGDARRRRHDGVATTVGALADAEPLQPCPPAPYPAAVEVTRVVSAQALVAFRGNFYSVPPGLGGALVLVRHRLGEPTIEVRTASGVTLAVHRREVDGAGALARHGDHVTALERSVLARFSDRAPCRHKQRRPPSPAALAEATRLRGQQPSGSGEHVVVDFAAYVTAAAARGHARDGGEPGERAAGAAPQEVTP
ncbi:MAG: Mu transposase domain-containing protein [Actinomycetota bacterium]